MVEPSPSSNSTSLTGRRVQAKTPQSHPAQKPLPQLVQPNATTVLVYRVQLLPCWDALGTPALLCLLQNGQPGWGGREGDIWGGGHGGEVSMCLSNQCLWTLKHGCGLGGCQQQVCLSRDLCPPALLSSILCPSPSPWFWRSSVALLPCHGDAASHPGCTNPSSFSI